MPIPNIYSYIKLSFVFEKSVVFTFCIKILCFLKIWWDFSNFMLSISFQTEYFMKTKFFSLPKDGVQHLKSGKPGLIFTKYWF